MHINNNLLKQVLFLLLLFALGGFLFWMLKGFLSAFLGAVVFYVLLRKPYFFLTEKVNRKWNRYLAVVTLLLFSFVVMVLPVMLVTLMLSGKVSYLLTRYNDLLLLAEQFINSIEQYLGIDLISADMVGKLTGLAADILPGFLSATANVVTDVFVLYFILYFMLINARHFENTVRQNMPFKDENDGLLLTELKTQTISNSIGMVVLALLQALTAFLGYWIFGVKEPFFWAIITGIMSVLPVVGTTIVWLPLAVFLFVSGDNWQALAVLAYGAVVITNVDNVFRFVIQKKLGDVHPLITFFGVIIGLNVFGFVGLVFGPLLISYFIILIKIYMKEYVLKT